MWRKRIPSVASIAFRTKPQRVAGIALAFCLLNACWSIVGEWSISLGGVSYHYLDSAWRQSGIFSWGGYLVIAQRSSFFAGTGVRPPDWQTRTPSRRSFPWSISADMDISPNMFRSHSGNGIIDDSPRKLVPGLLLNWQNQSVLGEWYNRGIAVHWMLLSALAAVVPLATLLRPRRQGKQGICSMCGYDLRATPDPCPECGSVPQANSV